MLLASLLLLAAGTAMAQNTTLVPSTNIPPFCRPTDGNTLENSAGFGYWYQTFTDNTVGVCTGEDHAGWLVSHGTAMEDDAAAALQYIALAICVFNLAFYAYHFWKASTGWEEVYVVVVELVKVCLELNHEYESPASLYLNTGNTVLWIRYGEWLLTCPVILIHLSNITGLKDEYSKRTMMLLVSDIGCVVMGVTAAMCYAWPKWIFFFLGLCYGCNTYFHAAKVYVEAYHIVPKGICRNLVRGMAWCFYVAWTMFPLLFVFGPEGFKILSRSGSAIAHTVADIISKQIWGMLGHMLRVKIHEHIIIHGNITKPTKVTVAGMEIEGEEMVDGDDQDGVNQGTKHLANRESFIIMRNRLKEQGVDVRASFDDHDAGAVGAGKMAVSKGMDNGMMNGPMMGTMAGTLEAGRVILAVPDISMVDFFRQQFSMLPAPIELVPALGADNTVALVQQAMQMGGLDCVLMHPEFLRDRTPTGLVARLRSGNQRCVAFGWAPIGPVRELIEASGVDGWLEGPSFGSSINPQQLLAVLVRVQQVKKQQAMMMSMNGGMMGMGMNGMGMGMGMGGGMGGMGGMGMGMGGGMGGGMGNGAASPPSMSMGGAGMGTTNSATALMSGVQMSNMSGQGMGNMGMGNMGMGMGNPMMAGQGNMMGHNPLYGQPQASPYAGTPGSVTPPTPVPAANGAAPQNEAEMLQQLMSEITRLKSELGEN